jgi:hypothetical protein
MSFMVMGLRQFQDFPINSGGGLIRFRVELLPQGLAAFLIHFERRGMPPFLSIKEHQFLIGLIGERVNLKQFIVAGNGLSQTTAVFLQAGQPAQKFEVNGTQFFSFSFGPG